MATLSFSAPAPTGTAHPSADAIVGLAGFAMAGLVAFAMARGLATGGLERVASRNLWLTIHLATVLPTLPLGAWLLAARKGGRAHRLGGRIWAMLMIVTALASFGVRTSGHLSWIHILSAVVLVSVPRAVLLAMRGRIAQHRTAIRGVYIGLIAAGIFTFLPGRLLGQWLMG